MSVVVAYSTNEQVNAASKIKIKIKLHFRWVRPKTFHMLEYESGAGRGSNRMTELSPPTL
jgi:hypothetical protein